MRKSFLYKILLLFIFATISMGGFLCQKAMAETATVNADAVAVRSGPGFSCEIIAHLDKNTQVSVLQKKTGWSQVQWQQIDGWVADIYLNAAQSVTQNDTLTVKAEQANLRSGAGTSYPKVGEVKKGDILFLVKVEGEWCQVKTPVGLAYINASLVESVTSGPSVSRSTFASGSTGTTASPTVKVYVNGVRQSFDVDPIIENGRTLVPMAAIFKAMGASIDWNGATNTVTATKGDYVVKLTIGAETALIDGKVRVLTVPAKIVNDRTMVPLAFIGSAYGGRVAWDPDKFQVEVFCPPTPRETLFAIVIDEDTVNLRAGASSSSSTIGTVTRGQQFAVNTEDNGWYQVNYMGTRGWVAGWLTTPIWSSGSGGNVNPDDNTTKPGGANPPVFTGSNVVISYSKNSSGFTVTINNPAGAGVQINEAPGCITYNFSDCSLKSDYLVREDYNGSSISISGRNVGKGVQVQVLVPSGMNCRKTSGATSQTLCIYGSSIISVDRQTFNLSGENITIKTTGSHKFTQQQSGNTMVISLPGVTKGAAKSSYNYTSQSLQSMSIEQKTDASGAPVTQIIIQTKAAAKFSVGSTDDDDEHVLHILFINTKDIPPRNSLVVLDPGHGGTEIGTDGDYTYEKDINLKIALKVGTFLTQKGIRVEYTRRTDTAVALSQRGPMANLLNAALFVSIHCNGVDNREAQGTETWYWAPSSNPNLYMQKDEREKLAKAIQDRLAASLGRPNRGVKSYTNYCVLRTSDMPSALAEVAFLTNPEEERLLNQDSFQTLAAKAIADGIAACMPKR